MVVEYFTHPKDEVEEEECVLDRSRHSVVRSDLPFAVPTPHRAHSAHHLGSSRLDSVLTEFHGTAPKSCRDRALTKDEE